ncbi:hypothetical protein [Oleidesulfovibrio alaskensis]|uniref:hypothetical protein n=1 Tax=Oleidesulfovibrio alaskensis TaxID=58180 RepID=UPI000485A848|nr:hypothetical protein [Oleidesulfovibrio alaskensis]
MTNDEKLKIFQAQTENVKALETSFKLVSQAINNHLRKNDLATAQKFTFIAALTFSAYAEAMFSKLIHTPHAFNLEEIKSIKNKTTTADKWKQAVRIGITKISTSCKHNHKTNLNQKIDVMIDTHIAEPAIIRNKIAHGQWAVALNSKNTNIHAGTTNRISNLDIIKVTLWKKSFSFFYKIVNDIIQSPNKAHFNDYYNHLTELEEYIQKTMHYNLDDKITKLQAKLPESKLEA